MKHPMQKIYLDDDGNPRFRTNDIVRYEMGFSNKDFEQFVQLLGYSVCVMTTLGESLLIMAMLPIVSRNTKISTQHVAKRSGSGALWSVFLMEWKLRIVHPTIKYLDGPESGTVILRIDDNDNPAFWLEILLTGEELNELQVMAIQANMPEPPAADGFEWRSCAFGDE